VGAFRVILINRLLLLLSLWACGQRAALSTRSGDVFAELKVSMTSTIQVQTNGKVAWVVGTENAVGKNKAGELFAFDTFVTNVFEKEGDRWLMVSHHAGIVPK
jgi:ketosteroid isomerase-like protein